MTIGSTFPLNSFSPSGGLYISDIENKFIANGVVFGISTRFTVNASATTTILINPTAYTGNYILLLPPLIKGFGAGPLYVDLYDNPTVTEETGTNIVPINFNFNSLKTAATTVTLNPTITDNGTLRPNNYAIFSSLDGGRAHTTKTGGEAAAGNLIYDLNLDHTYLIKITNQDTGNNAEGSIVFDWIEI
jgi:hypothetical protein